MVYAEFGGQTECIMGNSKIENEGYRKLQFFKLSTKVNKHRPFPRRTDIREVFCGGLLT